MTRSWRLTAENFPAYILAGGKNTRFGQDKALAEIAPNKPQLLRLKQALVTLGHPTFVVADREDRYQSMGIGCLVDECPGLGPLAGLVRALRHRRETCGAGWLLLIGVDQARWTQAWFQQLAASTVEKDVLAISFSQRAICQPIPALYHSDILEPAVTALADRRLSLRNLLATTPSATIESDTNPRDWSFNTREELARLLRQL